MITVVRYRARSIVSSSFLKYLFHIGFVWLLPFPENWRDELHLALLFQLTAGLTLCCGLRATSECVLFFGSYFQITSEHNSAGTPPKPFLRHSARKLQCLQFAYIIIIINMYMYVSRTMCLLLLCVP
jgi:hypothetical protein